MSEQLKGKKVAALVTTGFEQIELTDPKAALEAAGAEVHIVSPERDTVRGWNHTEWGEFVNVDRQLAAVSAAEYDALLLPGGVMNPDRLRTDPKAVDFVREFFNGGKPIAAICHAPWLLVEAGVVDGYRLTSYPSIKTDVKNAGGNWQDQAVVVDRGLVTSRKPEDLKAFDQKMIEEFAEGLHGGNGERQRAGTSNRVDQPAGAR